VPRLGHDGAFGHVGVGPRRSRGRRADCGRRTAPIVRHHAAASGPSSGCLAVLLDDAGDVRRTQRLGLPQRVLLVDRSTFPSPTLTGAVDEQEALSTFHRRRDADGLETYRRTTALSRDLRQLLAA